MAGGGGKAEMLKTENADREQDVETKQRLNAEFSRALKR
jgi:hypothetical protein